MIAPTTDRANAPVLAIIEDATTFEGLRGEWDALLQDSAADCLFLTWEWLSIWWKHLAGCRRLFVVTMRAGDELVAIAPLAVHEHRIARVLTFRTLEFLGTGSVGSDYLDVIVKRGMEREAVPAIAEFLARQQRSLRLAQLRRGSCVAPALAAALRQYGWSTAETKTDVCPFIRLSGHSWASYLATLGAQHRYNLRRRLRNASKRFDMRFEQVRAEADRGPALRALMALHEKRWRDRGGSDGLHTPELRAFHEEASRVAFERGWLRLFLLSFDGQLTASIYGFRYVDRFYFYQSGFDPLYGKHSVGLIAMGLAIRSAIEEGAAEYDLLHGDEAYKFHWANEVRELTCLEAYPPCVRGVVDRHVRAAVRGVRGFARRMPSTGLRASRGNAGDGRTAERVCGVDA